VLAAVSFQPIYWLAVTSFDVSVLFRQAGAVDDEDAFAFNLVRRLQAVGDDHHPRLEAVRMVTRGAA
jgi:hypothetical protein